MAPPKTSDIQLFFLHLLFFSSSLSSASYFITPRKPLSGAQKLTSDGGQFELGLFQPGKSPYYYIGIWYSLSRFSQITPVWVANRKTPLTDYTKAELKISYDGNLILSNQTNPLIWSTNITTKSNSTIAVLLDSGNLVLRDGSDPNLTLWQSIDHPTHMWLPGGKLGMNKITGEIQHLTSWRSEDDPAPGIFSLGIDPNGTSQYSILWNNSFNYWTSGLWNGHMFSSIPEVTLIYIYDFVYVSNNNESYFTYSVKTKYSIMSPLIMDVSGQIKQLAWLKNMEWTVLWLQPGQQCQVHALCGPFGSCNENALPFCNCTEGFREKSPSDWASSDWSGGRVRKNQLQCNKNSSSLAEKDQFFTMSNMKLPDNPHSVRVGSDSDCEWACLNNCSCIAYTYGSRGCSHWYGELLNLQDQYGGSDGGTIFLRLAASELSNSKSNKGVAIGAVIGGVVGFLALLVAVWLLIWWRRRKGILGKSKVVEGDLQRVTRNFSEKYDHRPRRNDLDVPLFDFRTISSATNYFSDVNEIGHGGFGSVYKGNLGEGQEVAIKRLAKTSLQGVEEFKNEVMLIAKLQHKNHVRLMGCCIQGEERILIYEYMPNGSLDAFLFDEEKGALLDWKTRYQIIIEITRGLLYLHHDSRFRIIHRDLKASNILLDNALNPKISDFGMARIFGGDETADFNTRKVVGTYGYMSPEYAMGGIFSMKSDVFSFGVVLLEIISGRKNRGEYTVSPHLNLLAHAWSLWNEGKSLQLVHQSMGDSFPAVEALKCIKVGLLCVQERPEDRPLMSSVVAMLDNSSDIVTLPMPKQPGFISCTTPSELDIPSNNQELPTSNGLTVSLDGR